MFDRSKLTTYPIKLRQNKVKISDFGQKIKKNMSMSDFLEGLPDILAAHDLKAVIAHWAECYQKGLPVIIAMGAHVIKCGLSPLIIDLIEKGLVQGIALNGAGTVHDFEVSYIGATSEDVAVEIKEGRFGMVEETGRYINEAIQEGAKNELGMGESIGKKIIEMDNPHLDNSILATCVKHNVPITVHCAIGDDIIHMHPSCDGAALGKTSYQDFLIFTENLTKLEKGGLYFNIGSAVVLPEVFLKAVSMVRNSGCSLDNLVTVNMDMVRQYRPQENVVKRPTMKGGQGYMIVGHHEINLPLLVAGVYDKVL